MSASKAKKPAPNVEDSTPAQRSVVGPGGLDFESAMKRLEAIVMQLEEGGGQPIEGLLALYEEGLGLSKGCETYLQQAETRLERLTRGGGE